MGWEQSTLVNWINDSVWNPQKVTWKRLKDNVTIITQDKDTSLSTSVYIFTQPPCQRQGSAQTKLVWI